jgi:hypothetical protein
VKWKDLPQQLPGEMVGLCLGKVHPVEGVMINKVMSSMILFISMTPMFFLRYFWTMAKNINVVFMPTIPLATVEDLPI